jgi:putative transposon-encoded protein
MAQDPIRKVFYRRAIKVGNSAGVLLPKALLGADVRVAVIRPPRNIKKDSMKILTPILEHILGVYLINQTPKKAELLAISTNINQHMIKGQYEIDIVPLQVLKKSLKEKKETREKIKKAKVVINAKLLAEVRKII